MRAWIMTRSRLATTAAGGRTRPDAISRMKFVLFYEAAPDFRAKVLLHIEAHRALWRSFSADGRLLMIGPFADEPAGGAMGVFTSMDKLIGPDFEKGLSRLRSVSEAPSSS